MVARPGDRGQAAPARVGGPAPKPRRERRDAEPPVYEDPLDETSAESMITSDSPARSLVRLGPAKRKWRDAQG